MNEVQVVGFDPSLQNWGIVHAALNLESGALRITKMQLVETEPGKDGKTVRKNSDDIRRAAVLSHAVLVACEGALCAFVEVPVGSQSARAMASYGICVGILGGIDIPMIQVMPTEVKVAAINCKTASKEEMIAWATKLHPEAQWLTRGGKMVAKNEHLADAVGAIYAGMRTPEFQATVRMLKHQAEYARA